MTTLEKIDKINDMILFFSSQIRNELFVIYEGKKMRKIEIYAKCINRLNERLQKEIKKL